MVEFLLIGGLLVLFFLLYSGYKKFKSPLKAARPLTNGTSAVDMELLIKTNKPETTKFSFRVLLDDTNLSPEVIEQIRELVAAQYSEGGGPAGGEIRKILPDEFSWDRYKSWIHKFVSVDKWPQGWEQARTYSRFIKEFSEIPSEKLFARLTKKNIVALALNQGITLSVNAKKEDLIKELMAHIKADEPRLREALYTFFEKHHRTGMIAEKKRLLQKFLMHAATENARITEWKRQGVKKVEFTPAKDSCFFCATLAGDHNIDNIPDIGTATHPGCRCSFRPSASELKERSF